MKTLLLLLISFLFGVQVFAQEPDNGVNPINLTDSAIVEFKTVLGIGNKVDKDSLIDVIPVVDSLTARVRPNAKTDNYTLILTDAGKLIQVNSVSDKTITVPLNSSVAFPVNTRIDVMRRGLGGEVTIVGELGVTFESEDDMVQIGAPKTGVTLIQLEANIWSIQGRLK